MSETWVPYDYKCYFSFPILSFVPPAESPPNPAQELYIRFPPTGLHLEV